ncbi:S8 family serine peptidase [Streptosporangium lutulentum]
MISNSWGSFSPHWDFPVGHTGNYSDNLAHPFNLIVASLDQAGADVLFAAGNCGRDCKDGRCAYPNRPITGANSHPNALSVGGVDTRDTRVGYSSQGPGRLDARKPDICSYTHFSGSRPSATTSPTRAPPPPARSPPTWSPPSAPGGASRLSPAQLRTLLRRTARDRSTVGFDHDYGYGIADSREMIAALRRAADTEAERVA